MHKHIAILLNSHAGKGKAVRLLMQLENYVCDLNLAHSIFIDRWPENLEKFTEAWVIGGDGTINFFINKYPNLVIPFAIFKGGTGNDVAFALYGNRSLENQLQQVLQATPSKIDAGICNNKLFLNGVGIGFDGEILQQMNSIRFIGGHLGYLLVVIKKIFNFKEHEFNVEIDGIKTTNKYLLVSIFNGLRTGGGFYIAPKANLQDGLLDIVLCKPLSVIKRLLNLPKIEKGKHLQLPFITYKQTNNISITTIKELPAQIDGELFYANEFKIGVLKNRFWVLK